jgi:hypothetical protein
VLPSLLEQLKAAASLNDFAHWLQYPPSLLAFILYKGPPSGRCSSFSIPK